MAHYISESKCVSPERDIPAKHARKYSKMSQQLAVASHHEREHNGAHGPGGGKQKPLVEAWLPSLKCTSRAELTMICRAGRSLEDTVEISLDIVNPIQEFSKTGLELLASHLLWNVNEFRVREIEAAFGAQPLVQRCGRKRRQ